jgi:SAM-dependent methyltransferase
VFRTRLFPLATLAVLACAARTARPGASASETERLAAQARALAPLVHGAWVKHFVEAAQGLPDAAPRVVYVDAAKTRALTELEWAAAPGAEREALTRRTLDGTYYYETRYGTPLAYARALEVAEPGDFTPAGRRVFDFGYGGIGHLKMLAALGVDAMGVDVDPVLRALYTHPMDQGTVPGGGRVTVLSGRFPAEPALVAQAGEGYALFVSKNVLKRGYIHPDQPVDERKTIHLGVTDAEFLAAVHRMLAPGGRFLIYNICPGPNLPGKPFVPWADGRSPFSREAMEAAGFEVLAYDRDDVSAVKVLAHALWWDRPDDGDPPMDLEHDLQALYTLAEKRLP